MNDSSSNGPVLNDVYRYGTRVENIGDFDGDGVNDIAVGASFDGDIGFQQGGAVFIHLLNANGTIKTTYEIDGATANGPTLTNDDHFGVGLASLGDLDGDGVIDLAVVANGDDAGGSGRGAIHILFLNADGSVKSTTEINSTSPNSPSYGTGDTNLSNVDNLGDLDGDGVVDLLVGAILFDGNGSNTGAALHLLHEFRWHNQKYGANR